MGCSKIKTFTDFHYQLKSFHLIYIVLKLSELQNNLNKICFELSTELSKISALEASNMFTCYMLHGYASAKLPVWWDCNQDVVRNVRHQIVRHPWFYCCFRRKPLSKPTTINFLFIHDAFPPTWKSVWGEGRKLLFASPVRARSSIQGNEPQ